MKGHRHGSLFLSLLARFMDGIEENLRIRLAILRTTRNQQRNKENSDFIHMRYIMDFRFSVT